MNEGEGTSEGGNARLTPGRIFRFWYPLALTWVMMSLEGPYLAAILARLEDPVPNLAAYGVAFVLAMLFESPIIMLLSASTALVTDRESYRRLRNFTFVLSGASTLLMALLALPFVFRPFALSLLGLPEDVAALAHRAVVILLPWPAAIGYRRFYNGVVIRSGRTRRVAVGTAVRMAAMGGAMVLFGVVLGLDGAVAGAASLAMGVVVEAAASRLMARPSLADLPREGPSGEPPPTYGAIARFYYPLALTAVIFLAVHPVVTLFLGRSRLPLESLAALPVVNGLVFLFGSAGISYQEVAIALMGRRKEHFPELGRFALVLGGVLVALFASIVFTPLADVWFVRIAGLTEDLVAVALPASRILVVQPALTLALAFLRSVLVVDRTTAPATWATVVEVSGIVTGLVLGIYAWDWVGVVAAAAGYVFGRAAATAYIAWPASRALRMGCGTVGVQPGA
jgi:Na+-driven multidrug efflux pump